MDEKQSKTFITRLSLVFFSTMMKRVQFAMLIPFSPTKSTANKALNLRIA
jgi:hypothetical protein